MCWNRLWSGQKGRFQSAPAQGSIHHVFLWIRPLIHQRRRRSFEVLKIKGTYKIFKNQSRKPRKFKGEKQGSSVFLFFRGGKNYADFCTPPVIQLTSGLQKNKNSKFCLFPERKHVVYSSRFLYPQEKTFRCSRNVCRNGRKNQRESFLNGKKAYWFFKDSLNDSRDPDRGLSGDRYTARQG